MLGQKSTAGGARSDPKASAYTETTTTLVISYYVGASEENGAMYGVLDVAEQVRMGVSPESIDGRTVDPELPSRAIKFNLPWSPYRVG